MATLQNTDLLLLNRGNVTYKGTMAQVSEIVEQNLTSNNTLFLNSLGDVNTGVNGLTSAMQGKFLLADPAGMFIPISFRTAVDAEIELFLAQNPSAGSGVTSIFGAAGTTLTDVVQTGYANETEKYAKTILLGQEYALGTGDLAFKAVDFDTEVEGVITNFFNPNSPEYGGVEIPKRLNDLLDVNYTASIQRDDYLKFTGANWIEASLRTDVIDIITKDPTFPGIPAENLPKAKLWDITDTDNNGVLVPVTDALGVVAVARKADQILTVTAEGVLDIELNIPDTFTYVGNVYFDGAGAPYKDELAAAGMPVPADVQVGDVFVALPTNRGASNPLDPTDPTIKRELNGWKSAADPTAGVKVESGSLVVCSQAADSVASTPALFVEMGVVDNEIVAQNLQSVLDEGNTATDKNIELTRGNVSLTVGSFSTTQGMISTIKGNLLTVDGDVIIGAKGDENKADPTDTDFDSNVLSVPGIDFARFPDIGDAPDPVVTP